MTAADAYSFTALAADGVAVELGRYRGQTTLIVNTASQCGFTPQYAALQSLYARYRDRGFAVLAFPCNQFAHQEPGSNADIAAFCESRFRVDFPVFAKIDVNGPKAHPLYRFLKSARKGVFATAAIKWNFTKFLVDSDGRVVARYAPATRPESIAPDIERLLGLEGQR